MRVDREILREHFVKDFHKLNRPPDTLNGWEERLIDDIRRHFSGKGYRLDRNGRSKPGCVGFPLYDQADSSIGVDLMGIWVQVPRDIARKILVLGEVPDLHKII